MSDITRFCGADSREWMRRPFRSNGYAYATNGHIAVRIKADEGFAEFGSDGQEKVVALFDRCAQAEYTWHPVPVITDWKECRYCNGTGKSRPCEDCDGEGDFDRGRHTYECQECDGSGVVAGAKHDKTVCGDCAGTGISSYDGADVAHAHYAKRYLRLIAEQFPGAEIGVPKDETNAAMWRCGDVVGLLMPMRK